MDGFANDGRTDGFEPANILIDWFCRLGEISIRQDESYLPEMRKHYNTCVGGWLVVHAETRCVCVCVCFCSRGASRSWGHATRHFGGGASPLPSGDTQESVTSVCLVAFGVLTTYLTSQSFQKVRVDALRAEGASQQVE